MGISRTIANALRVSTALLITSCAFAFVLASQPSSAYAEQASGNTLLTTQSDIFTQATTTASTTPTQINASMVTLTDTLPTEAYTRLTVSMANGSTTMTSGTDYTYISPSTAANTETGKTIELTGRGKYAGRVRINYKITVEGSAFEERNAANYVQVRYSKSKGFRISLGPAGRADEANITVDGASQNKVGTLKLRGKGALAGNNVSVTYTIEELVEITESMVTATPTSNGKSLSVVVKDGSRTLKEGEHYTLDAIVPEGHDADGQPLHVHVTGKGTCSGEVDYYCIASGSSLTKVKYLPDCKFDIADKVFLYEAGKTQKPSSIIVTDNDTKLALGTDYKVEYPDNSTDVGDYTLKVVGIGNYRGVEELTYSIKKKSDKLQITLLDNQKSFTFSNRSQQPTFGSSTAYSRVEVMGEDGQPKVLAKDKDYEVEIRPSTTVNAGTYTVTVTGIGDYAEEGATQTTFEIRPADLRVTYSYFTGYNSYPSSYYYTGKAIKPTLSTVNANASGYTVSMTANKDYVVKEYLNNINVGNSTDENKPPTIVLEGKGNFKGEDYVNFTILPCPLSSSYVTMEYNSYTYNGKALKPKPKSVKIKSSGVTLKEGTDYAIDTDAFANNVNAGTAIAGIIAKGKKLSGSMTSNFTIKPKSIASSNITVSSISSKAYTGAAQTPGVTVKDTGTGKALKAGTLNTYYTYDYTTGSMKPFQQLESGADYSISYSNNTNPGTATVKITGGNNYTGTRSTTFRINGTGTAPKVKAENKGNGTVKLSWGLIYGATKFMVLEKMPNGTYKTLSNNWTSRQCLIGNLSTTRTHRFLVRAYIDRNKAWSSKADANLVSIKPTGASKPILHATSKSKTSVTLSWNAVPGADRYAIYEKVGSRFQALTTSHTATGATINQLAKKGKYSFYVRAFVDKKWTKFKKSDIVTISPADPNPAVVKATSAGKGKVKLTWSKARNAKKYRVQMKLPNGKWKTLVKGTKKLKYTAKGLSAGKSYTFRVRSFGNGKWSRAYDEFNVSAKAGK